VVKNKWFRCQINDYGDSKNYFAITTQDECIFVDYCKSNEDNFMVVDKNRECLLSCAKIDDSLKSVFIQYRDFCIYSQDGNNIFEEGQSPSSGDYELIPNNGYKILKCNKAEYKDSSTYPGMNYTKCLKGTSCPNNYYDYETHECLTGCGTKKKIKRSTDPEQIKYECVSECNNNTAFYYIKANENECYNQCPSNTYYYNGTQRPIECVDSCGNDFIVVENHNDNSIICNKTCDIGKIYNNTDNKLYCTKGTCPEQYTLTYSNACLNNCKQTIDLFKIETFKIEENKCTDNCYQYNKYYKNKISDAYECVANCGSNYIYNLECVSTCPDEAKYYYTHENDINKKECVSKCPDGYYLQGDVCYKGYCPSNDNNEIYANDSNICVKCDQDGEYHIVDTGTSGGNTLKRCYSKCPADYLFHNYNENICYSTKKDNEETASNCLERNGEDTSSDHNPVYKYFKIDDPYTCYPSCAEAGDYKYELEEFHCSKEFNCPNYYYSIGTVKKCIEGRANDICKSLDYSYLRGRECVPQCDTNEYIALPVISLFNGIEIFGRCCPQKEGCGDFKYYCKCEKNLLRNSCPYKRIKTTDESNIISSNEGNCVMECPSEYPYENKEGTICDDTNNDKYYYKVSDNKFKIVDNCKEINKYHLENSYECISLDDCKIDGKFLYYDDDNVCHSSCQGLTNNQYYFDSTTYGAPQKCKQLMELHKNA